MATPAELTIAVQRDQRVDLPGSTSSLMWRTAAPGALVLTSVAVAIGSTNTLVRIVAAALGLAMAVATLAGFASLTRVRRTYRIRPEGLSVDGSPVIAWPLIGGAFRRTDPGTDRGPKEFPVLSLTDDGLVWLRQHGTARMKLAHRPDLRGLEIPLVRGCDPEQTAKLLSVAVRAHRTRLGLPPVA
ncbi:hypothetical protein AAEX63_01475 [Luteococcus sp. H138]|uniref:hypothetical protein n=1 Tax=unclassified Luteococcus TaxID=2639923 RepID=UPI00313E7832